MERRVAAVHDLSCFGRCSLGVVLPIISGCGVNCGVVPTSILSTHTGGFKQPLKRDLTDDMLPIARHWNDEGIVFDGIYTGYLGSSKQCELLPELFSLLRSQASKVFVDPVMGDGGKLYNSVPREMVDGMRRLANFADVLLPNITEACLLLGIPYEAPPHRLQFIDSLLEGLCGLGARQIVLKGVSFDENSIGCIYVTGKKRGDYFTELVKSDGGFHGSGDVFGAVLVGKMISGCDIDMAVRAAADFTSSVIVATAKSGSERRNGLQFEQFLARLKD